MASLFGSNSSRASQHAAERAQQAQINLGNQGDIFSQQYQQALPGLTAAQKYFLLRAGLVDQGPNGEIIYPGYGTPQTTAPIGTAPGVNNGQPFAAFGSRKTLPGFQTTQPAGTKVGPSMGDRLTNAALGIYNSPEYQALRDQAEEQIGQKTNEAGRSLLSRLNQRGMLNSSLTAGGQAAIQGAGNKAYSDYIRQLAQQAADKEDALVNQAIQSLNPSLNAGPQATQAYGQAGSLSNQGIGINQSQKDAAGSILDNMLGGLGNSLGAYLGGMGRSAGTGGGGGDLSTAALEQNLIGPMGIDMSQQGYAHGGPIKAGTVATVAEQGPEVYVPHQQVGGLLKLFGSLISKHMSQVPNMTDNKSSNAPVVLGQNGPEVVKFRQDGVILPNPETAHPLVQKLAQLQLLNQGR